MSQHQADLLASLGGPAASPPQGRATTIQQTHQAQQAYPEDSPGYSQLGEPLQQSELHSAPLQALELLPVPFAAAFGYLVVHFLLSSLLSPLFAEFASLVLQCLISSGIYLNGRYRLATLVSIGALISQLSALLFQLQ